MAANVRINVDLEASQATQVAGQLGQVLAQASINGAQVQVNPLPIAAAKDLGIQLSQVLRLIQIAVERVNISLAKTAKLSWELNRGKGQLSGNKKNAVALLDAMIAGSEAAIKQLLTQVAPAATQAVQQTSAASSLAAKKVLKDAKKAANEAKKAAAAAAGDMKTKIRSFQAIAETIFSPITIAIIAFEAVVKTFTYFWDNLTESIQKMTTRGQTAIKAIQRKQKALEQLTRASTELIKKLEELNKQQSLSIDQQKLAESIAYKLNRQYKDLGIVIDLTTGKYKNLYEAQRKIDLRNRRAQAQALRQEIQAQRDVVNAALANAFGRGINLDKVVDGSDFFTLAEKIGGTLGAESSELLAQKWNTGDLQKQLEVIDQLIQGLSSSDRVLKNGPEARLALATLLDYKKQLKDLISVDSDIVGANERLANSFKEQKDAIEKTKESLENLLDMYNKNQREESLNQLDPEDRMHAIQAEVSALELKNKSLQEAIDLGLALNKQSLGRAKMARQLYDDASRAASSYAKELLRIQKLLDEQNKLYSKNITKANELKKQANRPQAQVGVTGLYLKAVDAAEKNRQEISKLQKELVAAQKQTAFFTKRKNELELEYQEAQSKALNYEQGLVSLEEQRQKNLNVIQLKTQQIAELEKQIELAKKAAEQAEQERIQKQQEAIDAITKSYKDQIEALGKTDLENKIEEALQNAEKAKGDVLSRGLINDITMYITQLEKLKLLEEEKRKIELQLKAMSLLFIGYQEKQTLDYMKMVGQQKEAVLLEAKLNAEKAKGAKLTDAEVNALKQYLEVDDIISKFNLNQKVELDKPEVITNDLARKGGWASSVVVDRSVDINEQILKVEQSQKDILSNIKDLVDKYSVIQ